MDKKYYIEELYGNRNFLWHKLVYFAFKKANIVEFVLNSDKDKWDSMIHSFLPVLVEGFYSHWRWQHKQFEEITFLRFYLTNEIREYILSKPQLGDWSFPQPEDPTFYNDENVIMWTISHEQMAFLLLAEEEIQPLQKEGFSLSKTLKYLPHTKKERNIII